MSRGEPLTDVESDWVRPYWLHRQLDQPSPGAGSTGAGGGGARNVAHRNWTAVGNLDSDRQATVDPRGLVTPWPGGWSLDWWIGADDRWHVPAREVAVRQRLLDAAPVVETMVRIPGGDAVQRVYAMRRSSLDGGGELVIVEVENASKVPVALALAVRPYDAEGLARVGQVDLHDGTTVTVDGAVALLLPKPPARLAASTLTGGDSAQEVLSGAAPASWAGAAECPAGRAQAAFVYPLAHGAVLRVALPLEPPPTTRRRRGRRPRGSAAVGGPASRAGRGGLRRPTAAPAVPTFPEVVPPASHVAKGWVAQSRRGMRLELPDPRLAEAVEANRRFLLLLHRDAADSATALLPVLDGYGFHDESAAALASSAAHQRPDGAVVGQGPETEATGALLWALGRHWRLARDGALLDATVPTIAAAAHWIERTHRRGAGEGALWGVAGLRAAADMLHAADQPDAARDAARFADVLWTEAGQLARSGEPVVGDRWSRTAEALAACTPLGLLPHDDAGVVAAADTWRERFTSPDGRAVHSDADRSGLSQMLTLRLATVELRGGDRRCLDRLEWVLDAATPTWTWPGVVHPEVSGGMAGAGHDVATAAALLAFVRTMLVREDGDGLVLASVVPAGWLGQSWEVHDAPTDHGRLSYAVRWHGPRPALLWELEPHPDDDPAAVRLSAPGLDPAWSSTEPRGEALLAPAATPTGA